MISFGLSLVALILGYLFYGKFVERVFGPDDRPTPAVALADGVDYIKLPGWRIFMIQFLNIAGTGPIFGAIMGAKFGPAAYLWIVFGCIFAGAVHDYFSGMLSMRHGGANMPELVGHYLGENTRKLMLFFSVVLLMMVGVVFVYSPAEILARFGDANSENFFSRLCSSEVLWIVIIFIYYLLATMLPVDKIIARFYPIFAFSLIFMAVALMVVMLVKMPAIPEFWDGLGNWGTSHLTNFKDQLFPCLFITIACGAISGFHGTQSPIMARCVGSEKMGRPVFYGAMITEGIVALIWASVSMYFFYNDPQPGYEVLEGVTAGASSSSPAIVTIVCQDWLGLFGGILAVLGVVAAPITSGDTAFRSARLIISEAVKLPQKSIKNRYMIAIPVFVVALLLLWWSFSDSEGFQKLWSWFGWSNQTLATFTLWTAVVFLVRAHKPYIFVLIPALFMTCVCATFFFISPLALGWSEPVAYGLGGVCLVVACVWFFLWHRKEMRNEK